MALHPSRSSRRDFLRGGVAVGASALLSGAGSGSRAAAADTSAWQEYLSPSFNLRALAKRKGKIIAYTVGPFEVDPVSSPTFRKTVYDEGNGVECDEVHWYEAGDVSLSTLPTSDMADINWAALDKVIDFVTSSRQTAGSEHFAAQALINGDMGAGESSVGDQRVPDWLINGGYTYAQSIQMANQYVRAAMLHLQQKGTLNPKDPNAGKTLRVGVLNELLNDNVDGRGNILIDLNDPMTWFKKANYWTNQAFSAGDQFKNGYPEFVKQALIIARKYGGDALLGISDWNIETWNDYQFGGPNQKAQAMYNLIKLLKTDTDLKNVFDQGFYVGMQGHFESNVNLQSLLQTGVDAYAQDFGETVRRFKDDLGVEVVLTETAIAATFNNVTISDSDQANIENALALAAFQSGVDEWVVFALSDFIRPQYRESIFDAQFNRKLSYAGLAAALDGKRITF